MSSFLIQHEAMIHGIDIEKLRLLFAYGASKLPGRGDVAVGVDEVMDLGAGKAKAVISELAGAAAIYHKKGKSMCAVLVSSLATEVIATKTGRTMLELAPIRPTKDTITYFTSKIPDDTTRNQSIALANAVSGRHVRSIVLACQCLGQNADGCTVDFLFSEMINRLGSRLKDDELGRVVDYAKFCIEKKIEDNPIHFKTKRMAIEYLFDDGYAVPPVFLKMGFDKHSEKSKHRLGLLLNSFAGKHLGKVAKFYDLFRESLNLPVVPVNAKVSLANATNATNAAYVTVFEKKWYYELMFDTEDMEESDASLLVQTQSRDGGGQPASKTIPTEVVPTLGVYYHPESTSHPWIDRAFVAKHHTNKLRLVLAQDKVNNDFPQACVELNAAADALTQRRKFDSVLLVVNVIGATSTDDRTQKLAQLKYPYILIQGEAEVRGFYSVNFADIVWFSRQRHILIS